LRLFTWAAQTHTRADQTNHWIGFAEIWVAIRVAEARSQRELFSMISMANVVH
jgi:hypothetical protein